MTAFVWPEFPDLITGIYDFWPLAVVMLAMIVFMKVCFQFLFRRIK